MSLLSDLKMIGTAIYDIVADFLAPVTTPLDVLGAHRLAEAEEDVEVWPVGEYPELPYVPAGGVEPSPGRSATGGHHPVEPTSELLACAAAEIESLGAMAYSRPQPWVLGFAAELRDRAAQFRACGD